MEEAKYTRDEWNDICLDEETGSRHPTTGLHRALNELVDLRARLHHDCPGCPGCSSNDCPDAVDALCAQLVEVREELANRQGGNSAAWSKMRTENAQLRRDLFGGDTALADAYDRQEQELTTLRAENERLVNIEIHRLRGALDLLVQRANPVPDLLPPGVTPDVVIMDLRSALGRAKKALDLPSLPPTPEQQEKGDG